MSWKITRVRPPVNTYPAAVGSRVGHEDRWVRWQPPHENRARSATAEATRAVTESWCTTDTDVLRHDRDRWRTHARAIVDGERADDTPMQGWAREYWVHDTHSGRGTS